MDKAEAHDQDLLFAKLVVEQGLARRAQVDECLTILNDLKAKGAGPLPSLGELLIRRGVVTHEDAERTLVLTSKTSVLSARDQSLMPAAVSEASRNPENLLGKFIRVRKLGEGGMGEVWQAWDRELGRFVALKFLKVADAEDVARFSREAQTAAGLNHPSIAGVYEVGNLLGRHFIAMQFVDGQTLDSFPRRDRKLLVELVRDASLAIHAAHDAGVIHRDIKPSNIMVETAVIAFSDLSDGSPRTSSPRRHRVYVMDFGLAKSRSVSTSLSASGLVIGTPTYMSPEQARGDLRGVGPCSDVYSLGVTLYELLANRPPFRDKDVYRLLQRIVEDDPKAIRRINPLVEEDLETITMKCLEKDPARRYSSALALAEDLTRCLNGKAIAAHPPSVAYRLRKWVVGNKVVLIALLLSSLAIAIPTVQYFRVRGESRMSEEENREKVNARRVAELQQSQQRRIVREVDELLDEARDDLRRIQLSPPLLDPNRTTSPEEERNRELEAVRRLCFQALAKDQTYAPTHCLLGLVEMESDDVDKAIECFSSAIAFDRKCGRAYLERANAYARKLSDDGEESGWLEEMEANWRQAIGADLPEECVGLVLQLREPLLSRASNRLHFGSIDGAIADYTVVLALDPQNPTVYANRGTAYRKKGDALAAEGDLDPARLEWAAAIRDYRASLRAAPTGWPHRGDVERLIETVGVR